MQLSLFSDPAMPLIRDRLIARHGRVDDARNAEPTDQLILSIISSNTSDKTSGVAFEKLRLRFTCWEIMLNAKAETVTALISEVDNAPVKAEQLITTLNRIKAQYGTLDLGFLKGWPVTDAWTWLQTLPGVGPKVAAATLNFSNLRKPILTVDRHLLRVGKRLGLLPPKADFRRGHHLLNDRMPNDRDDRDTYQQHWLMKFHSQTTCRAGTPLCSECPLTDICRYFSDHYAKGNAV
jgi:endonuclease-3